MTKERLQLERHLQIANDSLQRNNGVDLQKYITLEQSNNYLRQQLDSLDLLQQEHKLVEIQYREKEEACRYEAQQSHFRETQKTSVFPINGMESLESRGNGSSYLEMSKVHFVYVLP